jgi:hypothetical protein
MILRKGAIAAHAGEKVLIPINMRDGSVLAVGKGNAEWNYSAPHGAGRIMSRRAAKEQLNLEEYRETMKGIYTTSVNESTLDEAPMAYKSLEDIIDVIRDSVDIIDVMNRILHSLLRLQGFSVLQQIHFCHTGNPYHRRRLQPLSKNWIRIWRRESMGKCLPT